MTVTTVSQAPKEPLFAGGGAPVFEREPPYRLLGVVVAGYVLDDAVVGTFYAALNGRDGGKPSGVIEIATSEAVAHAAVSKMVLFVLMGAAGIGVLAVSLAVWLSSRLTRPLQRLARAAAATGAGDLNQLVHLRSGDEVETLANAFTQMTHDLHAKMITIAQSEERFRNLIEGSVQGIIIHRRTACACSSSTPTAWWGMWFPTIMSFRGFAKMGR